MSGNAGGCGWVGACGAGGCGCAGCTCVRRCTCARRVLGRQGGGGGRAAAHCCAARNPCVQHVRRGVGLQHIVLVALHEAREPSPERLPKLGVAILPLELSAEQPRAQRDERHVGRLGSTKLAIFGGSPRASANPALRGCSHCARACQSKVKWPAPCQPILPALAARTISRRERSNSFGRRCSAPDPANVCAATWVRLSEIACWVGHEARGRPVRERGRCGAKRSLRSALAGAHLSSNGRLHVLHDVRGHRCIASEE